jgi:hypothetical protein
MENTTVQHKDKGITQMRNTAVQHKDKGIT